MAGFEEHFQKESAWHSSPFYTGMGGYKMCLTVYANGDGDGKKSHVSVFTCLMHGEFDSQLKWPFHGTVTIQLVNQLGNKKDHVVTYSYTDATPDSSAGQVTDGGRSGGWGKPQFIHQCELIVHEAMYVKDDCLIFRVLVEY